MAAPNDTLGRHDLDRVHSAGLPLVLNWSWELPAADAMTGPGNSAALSLDEVNLNGAFAGPSE
eukprot:SAG11_NODE_1831_length_4191_cov_4.013930_1_plen_63_part_00